MGKRNSSTCSGIWGERRGVGELPKQYRVGMTLSVNDMSALWDAAAAKALAMPGMTHEDVVDVIGPREDPEVAECLSMLMAVDSVAGCTLEDFQVELAAKRTPAFVVTRRAGGRRPAVVAYDDIFPRSTLRPAGKGGYEAEHGDAARRPRSFPKSRLN